MRGRRRALLAGVAAVGMLPAVIIALGAVQGRLGANPIEEVLHRLGWWGLVFLILGLAITPLRRITGWNRLILARRTVGLLAFTYVTLHLLSYVVLDQWFAWSAIAEDILKRPFILSGFTAWLLLVPLAATSTTAAIRRLGKRWARLHRLAYVSAALGVLHYVWGVKADLREPLLFAGVLVLLLFLRVPPIRRSLDDWRRSRTGTRNGGRQGGARRDSIRVSAPGP